MKATGWTCRRMSGGVQCNYRNLPRTRKCAACGKQRPAKRSPAHMVALAFDYEDFVALNGGEHCAVCGRSPSGRRRLDRDHCHGTGRPRGLLCARCNRSLPSWVTSSWLRAAADYLERGVQ